MYVRGYFRVSCDQRDEGVEPLFFQSSGLVLVLICTSAQSPNLFIDLFPQCTAQAALLTENSSWTGAWTIPNYKALDIVACLRLDPQWSCASMFVTITAPSTEFFQVSRLYHLLHSLVDSLQSLRRFARSDITSTGLLMRNKVYS